MRQCSWCGADFVGGRGQIYCCDEHRLLAIEEAAKNRRENARRQRRKAAGKKCIVCGAVLSMYGDGNTCAAHINTKPMSSVLREIKRLK